MAEPIAVRSTWGRISRAAGLVRGMPSGATPEESAEPVALLPSIWQTVFLLICSNVFMTFAWYAHLRNLHDRAWYVAALASWGIALFEYLLQVPANRIGYGTLNLAQLKIAQE